MARLTSVIAATLCVIQTAAFGQVAGPDNVGSRPLASQTVPPATLFNIDAAQITMHSPLSVQAFQDKLAEFLERVFWEQGESLSHAERLSIVNQAIQDCAWLEVCREGDVVSMAVLRLVEPDLVADDAYRDAVIDQVPNPNQRVAAYLGEAAFHMYSKDKELFYGKVNFWWEFVKGEI